MSDKQNYLRALLREASMERKHLYPQRETPYELQPFEATGFQTYWLDKLVVALQTSDALHVLDGLVNGEEGEDE